MTGPSVNLERLLLRAGIPANRRALCFALIARRSATTAVPQSGRLESDRSNKLINYSTFVADRARVVGGANLAQRNWTLPIYSYAPGLHLPVRQRTTRVRSLSMRCWPGFRADDGVDLTSQRQMLIDQYNNAGGGNAGRGQVLYRLADDTPQNPINNQAFINAEYNRQFALTLYFGYLRRNPDIGGFLFWQGQINAAPIRDVAKQNALVCSFITAGEYQLRFGSMVPRSNLECQ